MTSFRFRAPITRPALKVGFFVARHPMMGAVLLSDASELLLFDHAASDTTDHFVGLVAQFAESGWLD